MQVCQFYLLVLNLSENLERLDEEFTNAVPRLRRVLLANNPTSLLEFPILSSYKTSVEAATVLGYYHKCYTA